MSYGIEIFNADGRTLVSTQEGGSFLACGQYGTAVASVGSGGSNPFPTTGYSGSNLIIARPASYTAGSGYNPTDGHRVSRQENGNWGRSQNGFPTNAEGGIVWRELLPQKDASINPSGYGLVVYDGTGTASSDILFSASDLLVTAELMAAGTFTGTSKKYRSNGSISQYYQAFTMDTNLDMSRYYVMVNGTASVKTAYTRRQISIEFNYDDNEIRMINYARPTGTGTSSTDVTQLSYDKDWAIFYVRNGESQISTDGTW